jgi:putative transposase
MRTEKTRLLRSGEVAKRPGLHPLTVRRWVKEGKIAAIPIRREARIPITEVERLLGQQRAGLVVLYGRVSGHGSRQERCEMEQAGRILRAQATRKQVFVSILPLLSEGLIQPAQEKRPAKKDSRGIKEQVRHLREESEDADTFLAMTNVVEQACNQFLETGIFPPTYEGPQRAPVLSVGQLTFAGDDGMQRGQTYRAKVKVSRFCEVASRCEHEQATLLLKLRAPDEHGKWVWGEGSQEIPLPETVSIEGG